MTREQGRSEVALLRSYMERVPVALLRKALGDHAGRLHTRGRSTEAEALLAEARALEFGRPARR